MKMMQKMKLIAIAVGLALLEPMKRVFEDGIPQWGIPAGVMYLTSKSNIVLGVTPMPIAKGSEVVSVRGEFTLTAAALNDVVELLFLPEDHIPVDWALDVDDIDSNGSPLVTMDVGILNAAETAISTAAADGGAKWATALTTGQAGGFVRAAAIGHTRVTPSATSRRIVGVVFAAAAATFAAGKVAITLSYRAAFQGK